jgi:hypothetical protein
MSLDPSSRESNVRDSLKKFIVDNIESNSGVPVSFDRGLSSPAVQGTEVETWVAVSFEAVGIESLAEAYIELYCCTKKDPEGFRLTQLRDTVFGYLIDGDMSDGMKRVPLYRSRQAGGWTQIGSMIIQEIVESRQFVAEDETKYKVITVRLRWGSKVK